MAGVVLSLRVNQMFSIHLVGWDRLFAGVIKSDGVKRPSGKSVAGSDWTKKGYRFMSCGSRQICDFIINDK